MSCWVGLLPGTKAEQVGHHGGSCLGSEWPGVTRVAIPQAGSPPAGKPVVDTYQPGPQASCQQPGARRDWLAAGPQPGFGYRDPDPMSGA
jgi:hypothetical protein